MKGNVLKFNYVELDKKEKNLKYSDNEINFILDYKSKKFTQKKVKTIFESKNNKKISTTTIKKIWENSYK